MKLPINIKVSGPGQTFDGIFSEITDFLLSKNCSVTVENRYPNPAPKDAIWKDYEITLKADHCPWGG